jgi:bifunctional UDP-N-acetylglucosamine pyrophosphorylase/glucosamine-1-phosphate N-acetyltransferase
MSELAVIVLAAGKGTRMKSALPKVMHKVGGRPMLAHVLEAGKALGAKRAVVVHGPDMMEVQALARSVMPDCIFAEQRERLGTGHAVSMAKVALADFKGVVLTMWGDAPLVKPGTLQGLAAKLGPKYKMAVLAFEAANPFGYGRLIAKGKDLVDIREELDASPQERKIRLCNSGYIAIDNDLLWRIVPKLSNKNAKGEYYLTDLVKLANKAKTKVAYAVCPESEVAGINDRVQLAGVERQFQQQARRAAMLEGATLIDPETVHFSFDTKLGEDVTVEPNVVFGPGVTIGNNVEILAFSHLEGATVADGARIGPYARLRPGAEIGVEAHIGNFVEVKKAVIGKGAKANHLSYIGDAKVGPKTNIGAGAITCNYDGYEKHLTDIGANVFVGSNTAMVAPVKIGDGASIAAGSVITRDIPADALAMTRPDLELRAGWAARYRDIKSARKAARSKS